MNNTFRHGAEVILVDDKGCPTSKKGDLLVLLEKHVKSIDPTNPTWSAVRRCDNKETNLKQKRFKLTGRCFSVGNYPHYVMNLLSSPDHDGWVNAETAEAATVFFNDGVRQDYVREKLINTPHFSVNQAANMIFNISESEMNGNPAYVCVRSILEQWANDRLAAVEMSNSRYRRIMSELKSSLSYAQISNLPDNNKTHLSPKQEEVTMKLETKHYVNDTELSTLTTEQRIAVISRTEQRIAELQAIKSESKLVGAEIEKAQVFLAGAVVLFDKK